MKNVMKFEFQARLLRKASGTSPLSRTLKKAVSILGERGIPHYVCGGYCVPEHGYPRMTINVDLIVPDVKEAMWRLRQSGSFRKNQGSSMTVTDKETGVPVDLLQGGSTISKGGQIPLPMPDNVSDKPVFLSLEDLISVKLSSGRLQDLADIGKLISVNSLPRDYALDERIMEKYREVWDKAKEERRLARLS